MVLKKLVRRKQLITKVFETISSALCEFEPTYIAASSIVYPLAAAGVAARTRF